MKTIDLVQRSPEWHAHRATHRNASDAPAMMACSKYKTRSQLLHELHTGITPEVDASQQRRFDDGHRFEELARPLGVQIIGEPLYPSVGTEGELSASFDGLTMDESIAFEHKSLNAELREAFDRIQLIAPAFPGKAGEMLPLAYRVQMEQQCMVAGCEKVLFMASRWDGDELIEERHCWYYPDPALRAQIVAGWAEFAQDLAAYVPPERAAAVVVAEPMQALPTVVVKVTGEIVIHENFDAFETAARDFLEHRLIREPKTDQDFADLDLQIKAMKGAEAALDAAEEGWIGQIDAVSTAKRRKDMLSRLMRDNRLMAEKLLTSEKERRRGEIVADGIKALADHIAALNVRLGKPYMSAVPADFGGAIKNKRSLASMEEAVSNELTRAKLAANEIADRIQINLATLREHADGLPQLFPDTAQIVLKAPDDLAALAKNRVAEHRAAEAKKEEELRESIRKEEEARAARIQREAQEAEDKLISSIWDNARRIEFNSVPYIQKAISAFESGPGTFDCDQRPRVASAVASAREEMKGKLDAATGREQAAAAAPAPIAAPAPVASPEPAAAAPVPTPTPAPAPTVIAMPQRTAAPATVPTLTLGKLSTRLGFTVTADFLRSLGFEPAGRERAAVLYHEADFTHICAALVAHIQALQAKQAA